MDLPGARAQFSVAVDRFNETTVPQLRARFLADQRHPEGNVNRLLEQHARRFILDELMAVLGWDLRPAEAGQINMLAEAYVTQDSNTQFLDYLGVDRAFNVSLLIFEAKRFGSDPPSTVSELFNQKAGGTASARPRARKSTEEALAAAAKRNRWLTGQWKEHFVQLQRYYDKAIEKFPHPPAVMAIGDGTWLVVILDPQAVFTGKATADCFTVFEVPDSKPGDAYIANFDAIYRLLAFEKLAPKAPYLPPEWMPREIRESKAVELVRGLRVGYSSTDTKLRSGVRPHIDVWPVVFVRLAPLRWIGIEMAGEGLNVPHEPKGSVQLTEHLAAVQSVSDELVARVTRLLAAPPTERELSSFGNEPYSFALQGFVRNELPVAGAKSQTYVAITGNKSHILQPKPRLEGCKFHAWSECAKGGVGTYPSSPAAAPRYGEVRAFFPDGRVHHCAADITFRLKSAQVPSAAQMAHGVRPALADAVFCQIFDFESALCCQTCVYFDVCAKSAHFALPCIKPLTPPAKDTAVFTTS